MRIVAYYLLVAAAFGTAVYLMDGPSDATCAARLAEPAKPARVSVTDYHLRTCRRFCRSHGQFAVRRIDLQGPSVRCICSGAADAEIGEVE